MYVFLVVVMAILIGTIIFYSLGMKPQAQPTKEESEPAACEFQGASDTVNAEIELAKESEPLPSETEGE